MGLAARLITRAEHRKSVDLAEERERALFALVNSTRAHKAAIRQIVNAIPIANGGHHALSDFLK